MTSHRRFDPMSPEGRLLAAGRAEVPQEATLRRAARHLGVSAVGLGLASASGIASASSATAAAVSASAPVTVTSLLSTTFVKAVVIGIGVGAGTLGAAKLARQEQAPAVQLVAKPASSARATTTPTPARVWPAHRSCLDEAPDEPTAAVAAAATSTATVRRPGLPAMQTSLDGIPEPLAANGSVPGEQPTPTADFAAQAAPTPMSNVDLRLANEVGSLDRARTAMSRGDPTSALHEIDDFGHRESYRVLNPEVMLVRIEALLALGRRTEAAAVARKLLALGAPAPQRARLEELAKYAP